ncbi:hypothetical protein ES319_A05G324200v1 [Gossypium barbadense]|uniref:Embryo surrounding factor 1 brassicaceae domain-containing protein n=2 Tax=Gossypium TaxID=3633 RepID=A0A5J5VYP5_GOSBA|nr:hypothetical protein ES319_A05G324200v1 [Gossypium barbadense]TYH19304.1 hypothetical protein ES288_A05G341600v1 [Gossypium darwinii]
MMAMANTKILSTYLIFLCIIFIGNSNLYKCDDVKFSKHLQLKPCARSFCNGFHRCYCCITDEDLGCFDDGDLCNDNCPPFKS